MTIEILYEDGEALVIDKPAGLPIDRPRKGGGCLELNTNHDETICMQCAMNTLPIKCRSCHKWTGLYFGAVTEEAVEHRACKRRRLE